MNGQYDLVATTGSISSPPVRVNLIGGVPLPTPTPTPQTLTLALETKTRAEREVVLKAAVLKNGAPASALTVTFVITGPTGLAETQRATTQSNGVATFRGRLYSWDRRGPYLVTATVSSDGLTASARGSYVY